MHLCGYACASADPDRGQKCWVPLELAFQMVGSCLVWCCKLNSSLLEERRMLLTAEPALQPQKQLPNAVAPLFLLCRCLKATPRFLSSSLSGFLGSSKLSSILSGIDRDTLLKDKPSSC